MSLKILLNTLERAKTHGKGCSGAVRWGCTELGKLKKGSDDWDDWEPGGIVNGACYSSLYTATELSNKEPIGFFSVYNAGRPDNYNISNGLHQTYDHSPFKDPVPTKTSLRWVTYMLGDASPWHVVAERVYNRDDPEWVNNNGFVIEDIRDIPVTLMFNFLQAQRKPFEFAPWMPYWEAWADEFGPRKADWLTCAFTNSEPYSKDVRVTAAGHSTLGHCHLHNRADNVWRYYDRFVAADPDLQHGKPFKVEQQRRSDNNDVWDGERCPALHHRSFKASEMAKVFQLMEAGNA